MSSFRSARRTVVTEIKSFVVDVVSRSSVFRQSVSARVGEDNALQMQDVNVSRTQSFNLSEVSGVLAIMSPEPVILRLTQESDIVYEEEIDETDTSSFALLTVSQVLNANEDINIRVKDSDTKANSITVIVYNESTGETEHAVLEKDQDNEFTGTLPTVKSLSAGNNFDGILNVSHGNTIKFSYVDNQNPTQKPVDIVASSTVEAPLADETVLFAPTFIFPGRPLPIIVESLQMTGFGALSVHVTNARTNEIETVQLFEQTQGVYKGQVNTQQQEGFFADSSSDSVLQILPNDTLQIVFDGNSTIESIIRSVAVAVPHEITATLDAPLSSTPSNTITVSLVDYNLAGSSQFELSAINKQTEQEISFLLYEDALQTGKFSAQVYLSTAVSETTLPQLRVSAGDIIQFVAFLPEGNQKTIRLERNVHIYAIETQETNITPTLVLSDVQSTETRAKEIELLVDGLFFLNGKFTGTAIIRGVKDDLTRCSVLHV